MLKTGDYAILERDAQNYEAGSEVFVCAFDPKTQKAYIYDDNAVTPPAEWVPIDWLVPKKPNGWSSDYYQLPEGAKELQDLIEAKNMNFAIGNIFKAAYRLGSKQGVDEAYDLRKIIWFAERELKRVGNV